MNNTTLAFIISTIAGLSTLVGALIIFINKKNKDKFISSSMAFASGVMITLSLSDLIPESLIFFNKVFYPIPSILICAISVTIGILISITIDKYVSNDISNNLYKVGIISMIGIIIHNIPEGIATFITTSNDIKLGISLGLAITFHNIPEGISIALPIYYATGKKIKAFFYTFISAISEPFGALIAYLFLKPTDIVLGIIFSVIAGIMIHIASYELLPTSLKYKNYQSTIISFLIGSLFVILNLLLF